ncbi:DUF6056 family protein [Vibrio sp. ZSDZ34]|uniref:DUF6056 family protein n=1 Tax=Vibrio gelatinilyticus TaxID=2893468 RepID=A0A9X1WCY1_9VIBR|nr:DUF6056 family protein [Vibrio gelatinilyticus]MCJ2378607.1 DUF6056 family protein [Vibrio gelatinilyticus]
MFTKQLSTPFNKVLAGIMLFVFALSYFFPLVADDFCHLNLSMNNGGWASVTDSYLNWNARFGDLLILFAGGSLTGIYLHIGNALACGVIFYFSHYLIYGYSRKGAKDAWFLLASFVLVSVFSSFGAIFLWRAGALNYSWALAIILIHFSAILSCFRRDVNWYQASSPLSVALFSVMSFFAGLSSFDLGAIGSILSVFACGFALKSRASTWRVVIPSLAYIIGFLVLYTAPGNQVRAANNPDEYTAISDILAMLISGDVVEVIYHYLRSIGNAMYTTNYGVALACLFVLVSLFKFSFKQLDVKANRKLWLNYLFILLLLPLLLFYFYEKPSGDALGAIVLFSTLLLPIIVLNRLLTENSGFNSRYYIVLSVLYILLIVDISAFTIGVLPSRRAYFPAALISSLLLAFMLVENRNVRLRNYIVLPIMIFSVTVLTLETYGMYGANMNRISKHQVGSDTVFDEPSYRLRMPQYYGWEALSVDTDSWSNQCYADYYKLRSVKAAKEMKELPILKYLGHLIAM